MYPIPFPSRVVLLFALLSAAASADIRFTDVTGAGGLVHSINGEGVCILDFDNDGLEDIFIAGSNGRNLLYRNLGGLLFEEAGTTAGIDSTGSVRLAIAVDYDADGYTDLLLGCQSEPSRLFRNNGDGTFTDVTATAGIDNSSDTRGGTWVDYNKDGRPDLYVGNLQSANILCRNNGDGTFSEVAAAVNAQGPMPSGLVMGLTAFDYDRDGDDDIFMAQDGGRGNYLLRRNSDATFSDVSDEAGIILPLQGMGVGVGDYDRDGYFDVYVTNLDESTLFRNNTDGTFTDVTVEAGVSDLPAHMGWGTFFLDMDNDGWLDLYNNNQTGFGGVPNSAYRNLGDGTFAQLGASSGLISYNDGIGSAYADLDNDGDLDIVLAGSPSAAGNLKLFRNDSDPLNWVQLTLHSDGSQEQAIGAIAELFAGGSRQTAMVSAGSGYVSQNSLRLHFGIGSAGSVDSVLVYWPDGEIEMFFLPSVNSHRHLFQGGGVTAIGNAAELPASFVLNQNYPNPFNPTTTIEFSIRSSLIANLTVSDLLGREIAVLVNEKLTAGTHTVRWNATGLPSGVYFYRLTAGEFVRTMKLVLLR